MKLSAFLLLAALPPANGRTRLGWMLTDTDKDGNLFVHEETLATKPGAAASFGDDLDGDDLDGDDLDGDDLDGDDLDGDDDIGALNRAQARRIAHHRKQIARIQKRAGVTPKKGGGEGGGNKTAKTITGIGTVAASVGAAMTFTITPKSGFWLRRITASGDTAAVLSTVFAGEIPVVIDPIDCAILQANSFHQPLFSGKRIRAGVPVTVNYTAGSTTTALRLTLTGMGKKQSC